MDRPVESAGLYVSLLGCFEVTSDGLLIIDQSWKRSKAKALLKLLALNRGQWLHREQVLETVWPNLKQAAADHNFRQNLHYIREAFAAHDLTPPIVIADRSMLALTDDARVDVELFRERAQAACGARTNPELYERALSMYRGDLLPEDLYEDWTQSHREEITALHRRLLSELAQLHELNNRSEAAIQLSEELVRLDPLDEEAHRALMRLHAESGNRQRALRVYERCRTTIREELGTGPSEETEILHQRIREGSFQTAVRPALVSGVFIGREQEISRLTKSLDDAIRGRGGFSMIVGEAGIGKTRIAEELATHARLSGAQVFWGRCYEGEGAPAYWPWIQMLRAYARESPSDELRTVMGTDASVLSELVPELSVGLPDLPRTAPLEFDQARFRLFDSVCKLLSKAAERRPVVLILDDLHHADKASLLLLEFLAAMLPRPHLLLLGAYRNGELTAEHHLTSSLAVLERFHPGSAVQLEGLSRGEVRQLIEASTGQELEERVAEAVYDQTDGNPFLVQELTNVLVAAGVAEWSLDSPGWGVVLPRGARAVIVQSLGRLSSGCRDVLSVAAVVGKEFGLDLLARVSDLSEAPLLEALEEGIAADVIQRGPDAVSRFVFRHALLREALYGDLSMNRRAALHRLIGEALEQLHGPEVGDHLAELSYHFLEAVPAGTAASAVRYARLAGERAMTKFAYEEAIRLYEKALDLLGFEEASDDALRTELLLAVGEAKWTSGDPPAGREALEAAAEGARRLGDSDLFARAALGCGRSLTSIGAVDQPLVDLLEEALTVLPAEDTGLRAAVLASTARALYWSDSADRRVDLSSQAVEMARRIGDPGTLTRVLDAVWIALWEPGNPEERLTLATEMLGLAEEASDRARSHQGHRWRMIALLEMGDIEAARREFETQVRIAHELRQPAQLENVGVVSVMWALFEGRFADAEGLLNEALAIAERAHDQAAPEQFGAQKLALLKEQSKLHEIEPVIKAFVQRYPAVPAWRCVLAYVYSQLEQESEARTEFERLAEHDFVCLPRDFTWLMSMSLLCEVCSFLNDRRSATVLHRELLPFATRNIVMGYALVCAGSVSRNLGILASTMRRWRAAERHFQDGLAMNERMGARPWAAWTRYDHARMLIDHAKPGDKKRAAGLLDQALKNARELNMIALARRAASLRKKCRIQG